MKLSQTALVIFNPSKLPGFELPHMRRTFSSGVIALVIAYVLFTGLKILSHPKVYELGRGGGICYFQDGLLLNINRTKYDQPAVITL